jgi:hypothetical protein
MNHVGLSKHLMAALRDFELKVILFLSTATLEME